MPSSKLKPKKIHTSLRTPCPLCGEMLKPSERMWVDGERVRCQKCKEIFLAEGGKDRMT
jgi:predicted RNA-binding Zn-ribbon protein involved in translation (DUF1610 family)